MSLQCILLMALVAYCQSNSNGQYGSSTRFNNNLVQPRKTSTSYECQDKTASCKMYNGTIQGHRDLPTVQVDDIMEPRHIVKRLDPYSTAKLKRASVHEFGEDGPFIDLTQNQKPTSRKRRSRKRALCKCCLRDRYYKSKELMPDKFLVTPERINTKICEGTCTMSQSTFNGSYGRLMYNLAKRNNSLGYYRDEFWQPRCYPKKMGSIAISYKNSATDEFVHTRIPDLVIKSCSCSVMSYKGFQRCDTPYPHWDNN